MENLLQTTKAYRQLAVFRNIIHVTNHSLNKLKKKHTEKILVDVYIFCSPFNFLFSGKKQINFQNAKLLILEFPKLW